MSDLNVTGIVFCVLPFVLLIQAGFKQRPGADAGIQIENVVSIPKEVSGKFRYIAGKVVISNAGGRA